MAKCLEKNGVETLAGRFKSILRDRVHRDGVYSLLDWLENETDFFTAPASKGHHLAVYGGLLIHSMNVYTRLREITIRDLTDKNAPGTATLSAHKEETVALLGLLHDVCKVGVYHPNGTGYTFKDPFPLGHGEKSLYLISRFIPLNDHEALAIRWHMGPYDAAARTDLRDLDAAMDISPWVWRLHEADMCASRIDESEVSERIYTPRALAKARRRNDL